MNPLKKLAGQTAIYGLSSIVGRLLNYLLVPLHTRVFAPEQFGVVTEMYSYVAFLLVLLTYGFETAYFRFSQKEKSDTLFGTSMISMLVTSFIFFIGCTVFAQPISNLIDYPNHAHYVVWFAAILAADAITAIPFARLRQENKAFRFAFIKLVNIGVNIILNVFWLWFCPWYLSSHPEGNALLNWIYEPEMGVGYVFLANLLASVITLLMLLPNIFKIKLRFDLTLWKSLFRYSFPLMIGGLAGITNEMFSRVSMKYQLPAGEAMHELGIFGACYKVAILMTIFIQTFRFAAEPFFFNQAKDSNAKQLYAEVMNYFVAACSLIYLGIMLFIPVVRLFIDQAYYEGLAVVPILLMANIFLGIFFNLSIWFKLNDKTSIGAWLSIGGALLTILLNYLWIPTYSYIGASWATFVCYFSMMAVSYVLGQKYFPIPYQKFKIIAYPLGAWLISCLVDFLPDWPNWSSVVLRSLLLIAFLGIIFWIEWREKMANFTPNKKSI